MDGTCCYVAKWCAQNKRTASKSSSILKGYIYIWFYTKGIKKEGRQGTLFPHYLLMGSGSLELMGFKSGPLRCDVVTSTAGLAWLFALGTLNPKP